MSPIRMSRLESGVRVVLEFNEAFNNHDVVGMVKLMSDDCVFEDSEPAPEGTAYFGKEAVAEYWHEFFRGAPSAHRQVEDIFGLGLRSVMRWRYDRDVAGEIVYIRGVDIFRVQNGLISQDLSYVKGRSGPYRKQASN